MVAEAAAPPLRAALVPSPRFNCADMIRALILTNMWPTPARPALGSFVADQVAALQASGEVDLEVFAFGGGAGDPRAYVRAALGARRRFGARHFDVVHAHFGLTAWPAFAVPATVRAVTLHGTDLAHPRSRALTLAALPWLDIVATVSEPLAARVPPVVTRRRPVAVLPTGVDLTRFAPGERQQARRALGWSEEGRYLLFPADPARPEKRVDRARTLARRVGAELITLGSTPPAEMARHIIAADAVLVTSERESLGLAALEALACEVPVLSTPVGIAPTLLAELPGALCAPFELERWREAVESAPERLRGARERTRPFGADACAGRVISAWRAALE